MKAEPAKRPENPEAPASRRPSAFEAQFGPRAASAAEFAAAIEVGESLTDAEVDRLRHSTGGRIRIAGAILRGRSDAGLPAADTDPDRTFAMLGPEFTPTPAGPSRESGALYLLALFSWAPQITTSMIDLVHSAFASAEVETTAAPADLTSLLTAEGLLTVSTGTDEVFAVPAVIRALMRRVTEVDADLAEKSPRQALSAAVADAVGRQRSESRTGLGEILDLVVETRDWRALERGWTRRSVNVFVDVPGAIEALLGVPEDVLAGNPILTLARSAARRIDSTRLRLDTDDMAQLLAATDFDSIVLPEMAGRLSADPADALTANEVSVLTMLEARSHRLARESETALDVIDRGRQRLRRIAAQAPGPTLMLQAELDLEHGRNLVAVGRFPEAMRVLEQVVRFAEIYTPNSPHPLLSGLVVTALAGMGHGHGVDMDRRLAQARVNARRFGMDSLPDEHTALCVEMMRSLDRIDVDAAVRCIPALEAARPTQYLGPVPDLVHSLSYVYLDYASIAAKLLAESEEVGFSPQAGVSNARFSGMVNILGLVLVAAGDTKGLQDLGDHMGPESPGYSIIKARLALAFGQHDRLWTTTGQILDGDQGPRIKSCAMALRVEMLHHEGRAAEAFEAFGHMLDYCAITSSALAVAQLSKAAREALISATAECTRWRALARSFCAEEVTAAELQRRLRELPETVPVPPDFQTDLTSAEMSLLFAIDSPKSVAQIARDFGVVPGTLKNRLSALYRKLGVRSRAEAVAYAHRNQRG